MLTTANSLLDLDGLDVITYQWRACGAAIAGATQSTILLTQVEVDKAISFVASYTDVFGQIEKVSSSATDHVRPTYRQPLIALRLIRPKAYCIDAMLKNKVQISHPDFWVI
jgi:hypothetical protein